MSNYGPSGGPYPEQPQDPWHGRRPQEPYEQPADPWSGNDPWGATPTPTPVTPPAPPSSPGTGYDGGYGHDPGYGQSPPYGQGQAYGQGPAYGQGQPYGQGYDASYGQQDRGYGTDPGYGYPGYGYDRPGQPQTGQPQPGHTASTPTQVGSPAPTWDQPVPAAPRRGLSTGLVALLGVLTLLVCGGVGIGLYLVNRDEPGTQAQTPPPASAGPTQSAQPQAAPGGTQGGQASTDARFATKGACLVNKGTGKKPAMQITQCGPDTYEVLARFDGTKDYNAKCGNGQVPGYQYYYFFDSDLDTLDFVLCLKKR